MDRYRRQYLNSSRCFDDDYKTNLIPISRAKKTTYYSYLHSKRRFSAFVIDLGEISFYNRTDVLTVKGESMGTENHFYPPEYLRETSMEAFEMVVSELKTSAEGIEGMRLAALGEIADAAFLLWQLAEERAPAAQQTIAEILPLLISEIWERKHE